MEFDEHEQQTKEFQQLDMPTRDDKSVPPPVLTYLGLNRELNMPSSEQATEKDRLIIGLESQEWTVRVASVRKLGKLKQQVPIERLCVVLREDDHQAVRAAAAQALGRVQAASSITPLIAALQDTSWHVRAAAANALGKQSALTPAEPLVVVLDDEDESVRTAAAWAIGELGPRAPLTPLLAALHDTAWTVRESAARALGKLGARVPREPLLAALQDQDDSVREAAAWALQQLPAEHPMPKKEQNVSSTSLSTSPGDRGLSVPTSQVEDQIEDVLPSRSEKRPWDRVTGALHLSLLSGHSTKKSPDEVESEHIVQSVQNEEVGDEDEHVIPLRSRRLRGAARRSPIRRGVERALVAALIAAIALSWLVVSHLPTTVGSGDNPNGAGVFSYQVPSGTVTSLTWSSPLTAQGGKDLVAFATGNGWVQVWNTSTRKFVTSYGPYKKVLAMNWPASGLQIAVLTNDGTLQLLEGENMRVLLSQRYDSSTVPLVAWSPDGKRAAFTTPGSHQSTVTIWTFATRNSIVIHPSEPGEVTSMAWSSNNKEMATASDNGATRVIDIWSAAQGMPIARPMPVPFVPVPFRVLNMAWSSDGYHLAYALDDGEVRVWDRRTYDHLLLHSSDLDATTSTPSANWSAVLAWSPDGKRVAVTTPRGAVQIWDANTGDLLQTYRGHHQQVNALMWSSDGKRVASADVNGLVLVWKED